jgi:ribose transport system permease protein
MVKKNKLSLSLKSDGLQKILAMSALVILYIFFSIFGRNFSSLETLVNILAASYYIGFLAIGETFVIITGGIDLSVGTVMICSALIGGVAWEKWNWPIGIALVMVIIIGTLFGLLNGVFVAKLKIPPFVATLGTMMISMGTGAIVSKVMTVHYPAITDPDGWFKFVFFKTANRFPIGAVWLAGFIVIASLILGKTLLGRYIYSIGSNEEATRLSGVAVDRCKIAVYGLSGLFAGLGGIVFIAAYSSVIPASGTGMELLAIAGVVIGGTSLAGGIGTISGTLIGVYIMSILRQGLMSMNLQSQWQTFFTGIVVIAAVVLDNYRIRKASEVRKSLDEKSEIKK